MKDEWVDKNKNDSRKITMKKLVCLFAAITAMTATITSYAATYETSNYASTDKAVGMETVLIYKGSETPTIENIVYVD